jgi:ribonuclease HI
MIYIYSDGSYEKNTGMGCGVYIHESPLEYSRILYKPIDTQSSAPRAEMQAMFRALVVTSMIQDQCTIYCDNEYVVKTFNIYWDKWIRDGLKKSKGREVSHLDLLTPMMEYYQANKNRVFIIHVPREYNSIADGLSKDARLKLQFGEYREE